MQISDDPEIYRAVPAQTWVVWIYDSHKREHRSIKEFVGDELAAYRYRREMYRAGWVEEDDYFYVQEG